MNNPIINSLSQVMSDRLASYFGMLPPGEDYSDMYNITMEENPNMTDSIEIVIECPDLDLSRFKDLRPHLNRVLSNIYPHATFEPLSTGIFVAQIPKSRLSDYSQNPEVNKGLTQRSIESLVDEASVRLEDLFDATFDIEDVYYNKWENQLEVDVKSQDGKLQSHAVVDIDPTLFYDYDTFRELYLSTVVYSLEENMEEI